MYTSWWKPVLIQMGPDWVDLGYSKGSKMGYFDPRYTIIVRARAYNDCVKERVLPKHVQEDQDNTPKMGPFWVLEMAHQTHWYTAYGISLYP